MLYSDFILKYISTAKSLLFFHFPSSLRRTVEYSGTAWDTLSVEVTAYPRPNVKQCFLTPYLRCLCSEADRFSLVPRIPRVQFKGDGEHVYCVAKSIGE